MGGGEMVEAELDGLKSIYKRWQDGYVILMSESDYPLKPNDYIRNYIFQKNKDFIATLAMTRHFKGELVQKQEIWQGAEGGRRRLETYNFHIGGRRIICVEPRVFNNSNIKNLFSVAYHKPLKIFKFLKIWLTYPTRRHPEYLQPYGGDQWFILRLSSVGKILDFVKQHPDYITYSKDTTIPDEVEMQTIVGNIIPKEERESKTLRYILWNQQKGWSPKEFKDNDEDMNMLQGALANKDLLFARKIQSMELKQKLDDIIDK
jgi:hypothetical protein